MVVEPVVRSPLSAVAGYGHNASALCQQRFNCFKPAECDAGKLELMRAPQALHRIFGIRRTYPIQIGQTHGARVQLNAEAV